MGVLCSSSTVPLDSLSQVESVQTSAASDELQLTVCRCTSTMPGKSCTMVGGLTDVDLPCCVTMVAEEYGRDDMLASAERD